MVLTNVLIAGVVVFVLIKIGEPFVYVAGAPLVLATLFAAGTYGWLFFRRPADATSRSRWPGSRGSPSP